MSYVIYTAGDTQYEVVQALLNEQSAADGLTATPSGSQTTSLLLTATKNNVTTVATAADGILLPLAVAGLRLEISNGTAATSMQVFGNGTDTINGVATATGVAQAGAKSAIYFCTKSAPGGKWFRVLSA